MDFSRKVDMFARFVMDIFKNYGVFIIFMILGAIGIAFLLSKVKKTGFKNALVGKVAPVFYWTYALVLCAILTILCMASFNYPYKDQGWAIEVIPFALLVFAFQYWVSQKGFDKWIAGAKKTAVSVAENVTRKDLNGNGKVGQ